MRGSLSVNDDLALMTLAFVSFVAAGGFVFLGSEWMAAAAFPIAFLIFMIPLPDGAVQWLEKASQLASAEVAAVYFNMSGTPLVRAGTVFELPGIVLEVAQECSGIRSSWVLFITSVLAAHLFLKSPWRRIVLVAFVIPLGILRNGFRILVIGLLCVHVGPHMIDSIIHRQRRPFLLRAVPGPAVRCCSGGCDARSGELPADDACSSPFSLSRLRSSACSWPSRALLRKKPSPAGWFFSAGMAALGIDSLFTGLGLRRHRVRAGGPLADACPHRQVVRTRGLAGLQPDLLAR